MNIKKLFSVAAVVTFVGSTFLNGLALAATPDTELGKAYEWAYANGITTMDSYEAAHMTNAITRAEMAKMLSNYAKKFMNAVPDTSRTECNGFKDVASIGGDLAVAIVESCQLGIMGQGIEYFRPNAPITRAEFGTALSRVLWGGTYEGGTPYYARHLAALQSAKIMNIIVNAESTNEIRGYVMLMLMRASEGSEPAKADCEDPIIKAACLLDSDECPAECKGEAEDKTDEKVKSGDLAVKATANNGKSILANGVSDMDTLTFKTSEDVEITRITLERYGYSTSDDVDEIRLEDENGTIISNIAENLDSKGQAKLTLKKDYRNVDGTLNATIVVRTSIEKSAGNKTIGFKVIDVVSTAKNLDKGDYSPYTYSVVDYNGSNVTLTARGATKNYNWEAGKSYEVAKFKLKAPADTAIVVRSFKLSDAEGNKIDFDDYLKDVTVTVAGKEVKSSWNVNKDDELTINLKDVELAAKDNAEFVVSIELSDGFDRMWNPVHFYISEAADISATDTKTESRVLVKDTAGNAYEAKVDGVLNGWYTCTFEGGKVRITSNKLGNIDASEDSTDIVIAEWEITTSQTIKLSKDNSITISISNNKNDGKNIIKAMRLEIAGDEYEWTPNTKEKNAVITSFTFPAIDVDHSGKIRLLVDTDENAKKDSYATFTIDGLKNFKYEDAKDKDKTADVSGTLNISRLTIAPSEATLTNSITNDEVEFKLNDNSDEVEIFKGKYTADQRDVNLNEFKLVWDYGVWTGNHKMTVYLYLNGEKASVADADLTLIDNAKDADDGKWKATDTFSNVKVEAGKSIDVVVTAQVEAKATPAVSANKFTLYLRGEDENGNTPSWLADKKTSKISVIELSTADIEVGKSKKTVLLRGTEDAVAEFTVKPNGGSKMDLESVSFAKPAGVDCKDLKLEGVNKDFKEATLNWETVCLADGFVKSVDKSGLTLKIVLKDEPDLEDVTDTENKLYEVAVNNLKINGKDANEKFSKAYTDAIITFSQKGDKSSKTTYTIEEIKWYNASTKISDIKFFADENFETEFVSSLSRTETLTKGDDFYIVNDCKGDQQILAMSYTVKEGTNPKFTVKISHKDYPDYFKTTGSDKLTVYDNGKDNCTLSPSNKQAADWSDPDEQPAAGGDEQPAAGGDEQPAAGGDEQPAAGGDEQPAAGGDDQNNG